MDIPRAGFRLQSVSGGFSLELADRLDTALIRALGSRIESIVEIWALWRESVGDIGRLGEFPALRRLNITNRTRENLSGLEALTRLRGLSVDSDVPFTIDLRYWPNVRDLCFLWNGDFENVNQAQELQSLKVFNWKSKTLLPIKGAAQLVGLEILGGSLQTLEGLASSQSLKALTLVRLPKLQDFSELEKLQHVQSLRIDTCKKLRDLDPIAAMVNLESLSIDNVGSVRSLKPLLRLKKLRSLNFTESTNIEDGETSVIKQLGLMNYAFRNRKHYNFAYDHLTGKEDI
jgi:hypothetical protein